MKHSLDSSGLDMCLYSRAPCFTVVVTYIIALSSV